MNDKLVQDTDYLTEIIDDFDKIVYDVKKYFKDEGEATIKEDVFQRQGQFTMDTDPLNPRSINPRWADLSWVTVQLKGSSEILFDTRQMANSVRGEISNSDWDSLTDVVKIGWFEDSGNKAYIATIHEFGLTGWTFRTPDGHIMGGDPVGRTPQARANVRSWFYRKLGIRVSGRVVIPERSMLRKTADLMYPKIEDMANEIFMLWLDKIII